MSNLLEEYGLIGDGETAALVHRSGSIDWLCWPRFDSDACFAALIGTAENGCWKLEPQEPSHISRRYLEGTLILETEFKSDSGLVRVTDFMPTGETASALVRIVRGVRGKTQLRSEIKLRFDYGSTRPWTELDDARAISRIGPDLVVLYSPFEIRRENAALVCECAIFEGEEHVFSLVYGSSTGPVPACVDGRSALASTGEYWRKWIGRFENSTDWPEAVRRSLITLKAMIYRPTGGIIAAPTTSLPEAPGGDMNWDYRFCWIRDAAFTLVALVDAGYKAEAADWRDWLLRAVAGEPEKMRIMYRVDGSRRLEEWIATWLSGYRWTTPVRIGNAASAQHQLDIFGELIDSIHIAARSGIKRSDQESRLLDAVAQHVEKTWRLPDHGLWELRGKPRHYVYSKVSAWVAIDRYLADKGDAAKDNASVFDRMKSLRKQMHAEICREGYDSALGTFVEFYGSQDLDASLLLLPLLGFLPVEDERMSRTISAIERELVVDGFVYRRPPNPPATEGAFLACTCWLAECQFLQGRHGAARQTLERVLNARNDLGLLAEEYDLKARRLAGNFPQALSHIALVRAALRICGCYITERGGPVTVQNKKIPSQ